MSDLFRKAPPSSSSEPIAKKYHPKGGRARWRVYWQRAGERRLRYAGFECWTHDGAQHVVSKLRAAMAKVIAESSSSIHSVGKSPHE
jgi:hypothetical protein